MPTTQWGNWTLNPETSCLEYAHPERNVMDYQVSIDEITNSAQMLDWIFQFEEKTWASPKDVGDFVAALAEIFGRHIAGGGIDHTIDPKQILKSRYGIEPYV